MLAREGFVWFLEVCIIPKEARAMGFIDAMSQSILATEWEVRFL